ncbi:hypothetical protein C8Q75DRAFT_803812 [Abortiporus biennis]|nr:hypothetical protein C8Q75DRAFT_803812 [Abortiporus biennis]
MHKLVANLSTRFMQTTRPESGCLLHHQRCSEFKNVPRKNASRIHHSASPFNALNRPKVPWQQETQWNHNNRIRRASFWSWFIGRGSITSVNDDNHSNGIVRQVSESSASTTKARLVSREDTTSSEASSNDAQRSSSRSGIIPDSSQASSEFLPTATFGNEELPPGFLPEQKLSSQQVDSSVSLTETAATSAALLLRTCWSSSITTRRRDSVDHHNHHQSHHNDDDTASDTASVDSISSQSSISTTTSTSRYLASERAKSWSDSDSDSDTSTGHRKKNKDDHDRDDEDDDYDSDDYDPGVIDID